MVRARVPVMPMVKADAYGLGAVPVARALESLAPWGYGVATVDEGAELRAAGIERPILVFTPILPADMESAHTARLTPVLGGEDAITAWDRVTAGSPWHLMIDTGMSRSGVSWDAIGALRTVLAAAPPAGACTHFLAADRADGSHERQVVRFNSALAALPRRPGVLHAENSPAIERLADASPWTVARPGVFLYGVASRRPAPSERASIGERDQPHETPAVTTPSDPADAILVPEAVVALRGRVVDLRTIEAGETVSYGGTFRADSRRRIATVPVGYADGYRRAFGNRAHALVHGQLVAVVGVVTMDMTMLDVTDVSCVIGDQVTLLGPERMGEEPGSPADVTRPATSAIDLVAAAGAAGLSPYEVLTGLRLRLPRVYVGAPAA